MKRIIQIAVRGEFVSAACGRFTVFSLMFLFTSVAYGEFAVSPTTLDGGAFLQSFDADGNTTFVGHAVNNFNAGIDDLAFDSNGDLYLLLSNSGEHPNGESIGLIPIRVQLRWSPIEPQSSVKEISPFLQPADLP